METVRLIAFSRPPGLLAAWYNGYFSEEGLDVQYTRARGSIEQVRGLLDGTWDIAHTAVDNVLAQVNEAAADLVVFFVGDLGANHQVVARPGISSITDLKGGTLGLDAVASGYAFMLYKILALHGVGRHDYQTISVGGTPERLAALLARRIDCALLSPPHDARAVESGCRVLAAAATYFPGYPGLTAVTRRLWAAQHRTTLVRYCRALLKGCRWAASPENRQAVIALLAEATGSSTEQAEQLYRVEVQSRERLVPSVPEIEAAIRRVGALRHEMMGRDTLPEADVDTSRYFDPSYLLEADPSLAARP